MKNFQAAMAKIFGITLAGCTNSGEQAFDPCQATCLITAKVGKDYMGKFWTDFGLYGPLYIESNLVALIHLARLLVA